MAGGRSERMRAAGEHTHKALLRVAGQTMLERNIRSVFWHGLRDVVVVSSQQEPQIKDFVESRGRELALALDAHIESFVETMPLANVGIARDFADRAESMLMVYVDNLTTLDFGSAVRTASSARAAYHRRCERGKVPNAVRQGHAGARPDHRIRRKTLRKWRLASSMAIRRRRQR
jgi:NDP-sugar pyrophosphorylase family protein